MAASETLSELLIKIRTVGEKEAKEALERAFKHTYTEQEKVRKLQRDAEKDRLRFQRQTERERDQLEKQAASETKKNDALLAKDRLAIQKAADRKAADEQKSADRKRIAQEKETQRALEQARKGAEQSRKTTVSESRKALDKQAKDREQAGTLAQSTFASGGRKFGDAVVGGAMKAGKWAAVTGAAALTGGVMAFDNFLEKTDELKTFAAFTSLTTERLQQLNFAVEQNGMSSEKFADGLRQFNAGVRESAKSGGKSGAVAEAVNDMGIGFKNLLKMDPEQQLFAILKRGNELGPSFARAGAFAKIFGEIAGAQFARIADQGVDSLKAAAKSAKDLGFVLEETTVNQAVRVKQQLSSTLSIIDGIKNSVFSALLPSVEKYVGVVKDWTVANRELIRTTVVEWLGKIEQAAKAAWPEVKALLKVAADLLPTLIKWGPALLEIGIGMKGLSMAKDAASSVKTLASAFTTAQGSAAAFAGAGGVGAIIQAFLILLPIALKVGDILGDIGSMESEARATLAQQLINADRDKRGNLKGTDAYLDEAAGLSDVDFAKLEDEVIRGARNKGSTLSHREFFNKAKSRRKEKADTQAERDAVKERVMSGKQKVNERDLEWLKAQGYLSAEEAELVRGRKNTGVLNKARKGEKDDRLSDAELMKLIDKATKAGMNLDEVLKGRKLAGTSPPVVTITQIITNVTATATMTVKSHAGQSSESIGQTVVTQFNDWLSGEIRKAIPEGRVSR